MRVLLITSVVPVVYSAGMLLARGFTAPVGWLIAFYAMGAAGILGQRWPGTMRAWLAGAGVVGLVWLDAVMRGPTPLLFVNMGGLVLLATLVWGPRVAAWTTVVAAAAILGLQQAVDGGIWLPPAGWSVGDPLLLWRGAFNHLMWSGTILAGLDLALVQLEERLQARTERADALRRHARARQELGRRVTAQEEAERRRMSAALTSDIGECAVALAALLRRGAGGDDAGAALAPALTGIDALIARVRTLARDLRREPPPPEPPAPDAQTAFEGVLLDTVWSSAPVSVPWERRPAIVTRDMGLQAFRRVHIAVALGVAGALAWTAASSHVRVASAAATAGAILLLATLVIPGRPPSRRVWAMLAVLGAVAIVHMLLLGPTPVASAALFALPLAARLGLGQRTAFVALGGTTAGFLCLAAAGSVFGWQPLDASRAARALVEVPAVLSSVAVLAGLVLAVDFLTRALMRLEAKDMEQAAALETEIAACDSVNARLRVVEWTERRRIAHELHDDVGQRLTAAKLNLQVGAKRRLGAGLEPLFEDTAQALEAVAAQTRTLSGDLRPQALEQQGLGAALDFVEREGRRAGLDVTVSAPRAAPRLGPDVEAGGYRILQEALTNVLRHADAERLALEIDGHGPVVRVVLSDDGRGFDVETALAGSARGEHVGLAGMRERAQALGGSVDFISFPGRGTRVVLELPVGTSA